MTLALPGECVEWLDHEIPWLVVGFLLSQRSSAWVMVRLEVEEEPRVVLP